MELGGSGWLLASYNVFRCQSQCYLSWSHVSAQKGLVVVCSEFFHLSAQKGLVVVVCSESFIYL